MTTIDRAMPVYIHPRYTPATRRLERFGKALRIGILVVAQLFVIALSLYASYTHWITEDAYGGVVLTVIAAGLTILMFRSLRPRRMK